jgi:hypothetical protein
MESRFERHGNSPENKANRAETGDARRRKTLDHLTKSMAWAFFTDDWLTVVDAIRPFRRHLPEGLELRTLRGAPQGRHGVQQAVKLCSNRHRQRPIATESINREHAPYMNGRR